MAMWVGKRGWEVVREIKSVERTKRWVVEKEAGKCGKEVLKKQEKRAHQLSILETKPSSAGGGGTAGVSGWFKRIPRARVVGFELLVVETKEI